MIQRIDIDVDRGTIRVVADDVSDDGWLSTTHEDRAVGVIATAESRLQGAISDGATLVE